MRTIIGIVAFAIMAIGLAACNESAPPSAAVARAPASSPESVCLAAVSQETGVGGVSTISVTPSESGTSVFVQVPGAQAPWNCVVDTDGQTVVNVYYTGTEGAL